MRSVLSLGPLITLLCFYRRRHGASLQTTDGTVTHAPTCHRSSQPSAADSGMPNGPADAGGQNNSGNDPGSRGYSGNVPTTLDVRTPGTMNSSRSTKRKLYAMLAEGV
jgi:hypothetical protein